MFRALLLFGLWHLCLISMQADQLFLATNDHHFIEIQPSQWTESALITRVWQELQKDYPNNPACLSIPFNKHALNMFIKNEECYRGTIGATTNSFNIAYFFEMPDRASAELTSLREKMIYFINNSSRNICVELPLIQSFCNKFSYKVPNAVIVNNFTSYPYCSIRCSSKITSALCMQCIVPCRKGYKIVVLGETFCIEKKDGDDSSCLQIVDYKHNTSSSVICDNPIKAFYQNPDNPNEFFVIDHKDVKQIKSSGVINSVKNFNKSIASYNYDSIAKKLIVIDVYGSTGLIWYENGLWKEQLLLEEQGMKNKRRTIKISPDRKHVITISYVDDGQALVKFFDYNNEKLNLNSAKTTEYSEDLKCIDNINLIDDFINAKLSKASNTLTEKVYALPDQKTITFANKTIQIKNGEHILFELSDVDDMCYTADQELVLLYDNNVYKFDIESISESLKNITQSISLFELKLLLFYYNIPLIDQSDFLKEQISTLDPSIVKIFRFFKNFSMEWMRKHY